MWRAFVIGWGTMLALIGITAPLAQAYGWEAPGLGAAAGRVFGLGFSGTAIMLFIELPVLLMVRRLIRRRFVPTAAAVVCAGLSVVPFLVMAYVGHGIDSAILTVLSWTQHPALFLSDALPFMAGGATLGFLAARSTRPWVAGGTASIAGRLQGARSSDSPDDAKADLRCSFCGKSQQDVRKLIAGPSTYICDECVAVCEDIIADDVRAPAGPVFGVGKTASPAKVPVTGASARCALCGMPTPLEDGLLIPNRGVLCPGCISEVEATAAAKRGPEP